MVPNFGGLRVRVSLSFGPWNRTRNFRIELSSSGLTLRSLIILRIDGVISHVCSAWQGKQAVLDRTCRRGRGWKGCRVQGVGCRVEGRGWRVVQGAGAWGDTASNYRFSYPCCPGSERRRLPVQGTGFLVQGMGDEGFGMGQIQLHGIVGDPLAVFPAWGAHRRGHRRSSGPPTPQSPP